MKEGGGGWWRGAEWGQCFRETLRESLANVIQDVNRLVENEEINVDGQTVQLEFFLGGDYKVNGVFSFLIR